MTSVLTDALTWILSTSLMASVLVIFILVAKWLLKDKLKPRWAYLLWILLVLRLLLPWAPESSFSVFNIFQTLPENSHLVTEIENPASPDVEPSYEMSSTTQVQDSSPNTVSTIGDDSTVKKPMSLLQIASMIWLVGMVMFLSFMVRANVRFAALIKKEVAVIDQGINSLFERCKDEMKVHRKIALIQTNQVSSPTLFGLLKPKLLIPDLALRYLNEVQLRYVFLHEISHVRRRDIAMNWLMNILLSVHWFNPFLWYAYHKMRADQETACDALALSRIKSEESNEYALTIIKLLELFANPVRLAGAASISGNKKELKRRLVMITSFKKHSYKWSLIGLAVILLLGGAALTNASTQDKGNQAIEDNNQSVDVAAIGELTEVWANALKTREGKPRYEMMSSKAKDKFIQEQIIRSGENWNYNIGVSSPWVVDFESEIDGMNVIITYLTLTSEPNYYKTVESLKFSRENGKLVVDDFETVYEGEWTEDTKISATDYERMINIIISVNKGDLPVSALKDAEPILRKKGGLNKLSTSIRKKYIRETVDRVTTTDH
ncbi:M56 family metallopeptidase [Paenibacillus lupini]|uniref:M56 family metallopeptidase n=1 Tax=Paenibacillus lupini TaxID=1450204 RepID=UPI001420CA31|nr:M56 family metallopeptidase [Paenibacillus lupini]NIK21691.1 bla regulator protein BlaR1 [Paenibacillus lupini]